MFELNVMVDFCSTILKAIGDYKTIVRKSFSVTERKAKIHNLGIRKRYIKELDEFELYKIALRIIKELKKETKGQRNKRSNSVYSGAREFLQYLEEFLSKYHIEGGEVVHVGQKASCALVDVMQLIMFSKNNLKEDDAVRIREHARTVATYGSEEQKKILVNVVNMYQSFLVQYLPKELSVYFS